jgi:hypothetical protein
MSIAVGIGTGVKNKLLAPSCLSATLPSPVGVSQVPAPLREARVQGLDEARIVARRGGVVG